MIRQGKAHFYSTNASALHEIKKEKQTNNLVFGCEAPEKI